MRSFARLLPNSHSTAQGMKDRPVLESGAPPQRYPSRASWDSMRDIIKRLYVDENKTLKEVMLIMNRDYRHNATAKIYKTGIQKWGLDKNTKEAEARAILRIKIKRDFDGKDSVFRLRGKSLTIDDILRYFRRKQIMNPQEETQTLAAYTPPGLECWTPIPSPFPELSNTQTAAEGVQEFQSLEMVEQAALDIRQENADNQVYLSSQQIREVIFSSTEIQSFEMPYSPLPPQSLLIPEKLFANIKTYYSGAFENGLFWTDDNGDLINTNRRTESDARVEFFDLCWTGASLMDSKSFIEGRRCFSKASSLIVNLLSEQDPRTLEHIFNIFVLLSNKGYLDIVTILRGMMGGIAAIQFPKEHPWRQIFAQIGNLEKLHFDLAIDEAWRCICDIFANSLEVYSLENLAYCYYDMDHKVEAESRLQEAIARCEALHRKENSRTLFPKTRLEERLRIWGRQGESVVFRVDMDKIIGSDDIELEDVYLDEP